MDLDFSGKVLGVTSDATRLFALARNNEQPFVIIDILIVATLFYFFYLFLRQTRALGILYGIIIIAIIYFIGQALDLVLLNTLLRWAFTSILVAIPVVFQPELRSALERLGRTTQIVTEFQKLSRNEVEEMVDEILKAVTVLSKNKYGALIVLTRSSGIKEYASTGEVLNAEVNHKLLVNIFTPKAPLHDGAVIISGKKIVAAASTLPLSENVFDLSLGTRHKAGLSLSMESDAIALIVSEETGIISLAINGRLQRNLNMDDLRTNLIKLLTNNKIKFTRSKS